MNTEEASPRGRFGPLAVDHPSVGKICPVCDRPMEAGQVPTLIPTAPASDEDRDKMEAGRAYNAIAAVVHESCVYHE